MAKLCFSSLGADAKHFEHFFLELRLVNTNAATADLNAIQNDVVRLGANIWELLCLKQRHVFGLRSGEGMMHRVPFVFLRTPFEERKICHPKKIPVRAGLA